MNKNRLVKQHLYIYKKVQKFQVNLEQDVPILQKSVNC